MCARATFPGSLRHDDGLSQPELMTDSFGHLGQSRVIRRLLGLTGASGALSRWSSVTCHGGELVNLTHPLAARMNFLFTVCSSGYLMSHFE